MESLRKFRPFYLALKRWFWDLIQRHAHGVISQAFTRQALVSTFMMVLFILRESFAWWSSRPSSITVILLIIRGCIGLEGVCFRCAWCSFFFKSSISSCMALLLFYLWDTWLPTREWLLLVWEKCTLPFRYLSRSLSRSRLRKSSCRWEPAVSAWCRLVLCGLDPTMFNRYTHWCTSSSHRQRQL